MSRQDNLFFPAACSCDPVDRIPVPLHWHEELEAGIVTAGTVLVRIGSIRHKLKAGDGFFINSGVLHGMSSISAKEKADSACIRSIVFHPQLISGSADNLYWHKYVQPLISNQFFPGICFLKSSRSQEAAGNRSEGWYQEILTSYDDAWHHQALDTIASALESFSAERYGYEFHVRELLSQLISLLHLHQGLTRNKSAEKDLLDNNRARLMLQYIAEHFGEQLSIQEIAASASISESECFRCFHTVIGDTPAAYIKQYRLRQAASMLCSTDQPVCAVCKACGFQESSHFSRSFRQTYGCTPSVYRQKETDTV